LKNRRDKIWKSTLVELLAQPITHLEVDACVWKQVDEETISEVPLQVSEFSSLNSITSPWGHIWYTSLALQEVSGDGSVSRGWHEGESSAPADLSLGQEQVDWELQVYDSEVGSVGHLGWVG
jgi:hypothetical protein